MEKGNKRMRSTICLVSLSALLLFVSGSSPLAAGTDKSTILRVAMLVPRSGQAVRLSKQWDKRVADATDGRLKIRIYWGGSAGDERAVLQKMRKGQLDAAAVTTTSLSTYVRQVMVVEAPGLFQNYRQLDAVLEALSPQFDKEAYENGFKVMGWGDIGKLRIFSKKPVRRLSDLRRMRPWLWPQSLMMKEFYGLIGATGVPLEIPEVYGGLLTGMVDAVFGSAVAAMATLWFTRTRYVSAQGGGFITGSFVIARKKFDSFPPGVGQALLGLSDKYQREVVKILRRGDDAAYKRILKRGVTAVPVDMEEVRKVSKKLTERFVGRLYSRNMLNKVREICARYR